MERRHTKSANNTGRRGKLSPDAVRYIRANPEGMTFRQLGERFGVKWLTAFNCYHGYTYSRIE